MDIPDQSIDMVLWYQALHHIFDHQTAIKEFHRILMIALTNPTIGGAVGISIGRPLPKNPEATMTHLVARKQG
ncbi:MAG: methyltransferase domain-containing protein [Methylococcales bacterium]|jgi:hypothetical protein|nr:methyltransferase domain-containing protein [Methylococcales bacterium]MBT7408599.1 methyltransferase domain-containing protein [Methylococcales bacterium]